MWLRTTMIAGRRVIAFDGKTLRGAQAAAGNLVHLLAGLCQHAGTVFAQLVLRTLLGVLDITDAVITADNLHCHRDTAKAIIDAGGH